MRRYLNHVRSQEPHVRRQHALRAAMVGTTLVVVVWVATIPSRLNTGVISQEQSNQAAAAAQALYDASAHLEIASTTYPY